ncbi:MAG: nucleoside triphosphate pyrophosphatase [Sandaracinaceae bacterium]
MIVLASASPRRAELLATLGVSFEVEPSAVDEAVLDGEAPAALVERLAREKAREVSARRPDAWVLGADTVVTIDGRALNKPLDDDDAQEMLRSLSGRWHEVLTGVALARGGEAREVRSVSTRVRFVAMDAVTIDAYVATGEGRDKAGAYAVQGIGSGLIDRIDGSYTNVVGLPTCETVQLLVRHRVLESFP